MKSQVTLPNRNSAFQMPDDWLDQANGRTGSESPQADAIAVAPHSIPRPLGDWVETWAKPIGCWLDRTTKRLPWQLAKIRIEKGRIYVTPPRPKWQRLLLACRLPASFRTQFCGCSACSKRRRFLNLLVPDTASFHSWLTSFARLVPAYRQVYRPLQAP